MKESPSTSDKGEEALSVASPVLSLQLRGESMSNPISRRDVLKVLAAQGLAVLPTTRAQAGPLTRALGPAPGWVSGHMSGAAALTETLLQEGVCCVFGIPGAQQNELWDTFKSRHLAYLLVTHEFSAATMADGYARSTGKP